MTNENKPQQRDFLRDITDPGWREREAKMQKIIESVPLRKKADHIEDVRGMVEPVATIKVTVTSVGLYITGVLVRSWLGCGERNVLEATAIADAVNLVADSSYTHPAEPCAKCAEVIKERDEFESCLRDIGFLVDFDHNGGLAEKFEKKLAALEAENARLNAQAEGLKQINIVFIYGEELSAHGEHCWCKTLKISGLRYSTSFDRGINPASLFFGCFNL